MEHSNQPSDAILNTLPNGTGGWQPRSLQEDVLFSIRHRKKIPSSAAGSQEGRTRKVASGEMQISSTEQPFHRGPAQRSKVTMDHYKVNTVRARWLSPPRPHPEVQARKEPSVSLSGSRQKRLILQSSKSRWKVEQGANGGCWQTDCAC